MIPAMAACHGKTMCSSCKGTSQVLKLGDSELRALLQIELWEGSESSAARAVPAEAKWSKVLSGQKPAPVPALTLESLSEFNPRQCLFRDGRWVEP